MRLAAHGPQDSVYLNPPSKQPCEVVTLRRDLNLGHVCALA